MPIKNYTTSVAEERTVGEITGLLAAKGARAVRIDYDDKQRPASVSFVLLVHELPVPFKLPCNFDGVTRALAAEYKSRSARYRFERNPDTVAQSRRIAWRIIRDWVAAQMAIIEAEQANILQVFLPYAVSNEQSQRTVYDEFLSQVMSRKQLPGGQTR